LNKIREISIITFATTAFLGIIALAIFYFSGNRAVVSELCKLGLPNRSIPKRYRGKIYSFDRCIIFDQKRHFTGVYYVNSFEGSGFYENYRYSEEATLAEGLTNNGFQLHFDKDSDPEGLEQSFLNKQKPELGWKALLSFEGRPSLSGSHFGHLGAHPRVILVDRITKIEAAPKPTAADWVRWAPLIERFKKSFN
jgi:hypothetical protein